MTTIYRQPGEVAEYAAASLVASDTPVRIGLLQMGIALVTIAANTTGSVGLEGVYELPKNTSDAVVQGNHVWWDPSAAECINAPVTGALFIGYAFEAAGASAATLLVKLEEFDAEPPRLLSLAATGNQTLAAADFLCGDLTILGPNTGALSMILPPIADVPIGAKFTLRKTAAAAAAITIDGNASETVGGSATFASIDANNDWATFQSDGSAWQLIASVIA
jgi:predicted RecA/RadA family phage recombinase